MQGSIGQVDSADRAEGQVKKKGQDGAARAASQGHVLGDDTDLGCSWFDAEFDLSSFLDRVEVKIPTLSR
jgi:hypothetical protein